MAYAFTPGGTVIKRGQKWTAILYYPDPQTGKRRQKWHAVEKKKDAEMWLHEQIESLRTGHYVATTALSVAEYFEQWLATRKQQGQPNTWQGYAMMSRHVVAAYGNKPLAALNALDLQVLYAQLMETRKSRTVRYVHTTVHAALADAVALGLIPANVAERVKPPRLSQEERHPLSSEALPRFLAQVALDRRPTLWWFFLLTGMRRGEVLGLRWMDLDWTHHEARIQQTWVKGPDGNMFSQPKTKRSRRAVVLPDSLMEKLQQHEREQQAEKERAGDLWHDYGLIFCQEDGTPLNPDSVSKRFQRLLAHAGLSQLAGMPTAAALHDLRHTHATLLLQQGVHPKIVSERLGHSSVGITLDLYSHMVPGMQAAAAHEIDRAITDANSKKIESADNKKSPRTKNTPRSIGPNRTL